MSKLAILTYFLHAGSEDGYFPPSDTQCSTHTKSNKNYSQTQISSVVLKHSLHVSSHSYTKESADNELHKSFPIYHFSFFTDLFKICFQSHHTMTGMRSHIREECYQAPPLFSWPSPWHPSKTLGSSHSPKHLILEATYLSLKFISHHVITMLLCSTNICPFLGGHIIDSSFSVCFFIVIFLIVSFIIPCRTCY